MSGTKAQRRFKRPHSTRILELSRPKEIKTIWITSQGPRVQWGTQEALWPVTRQALSAPCTPRLANLSEPKKTFQVANHRAEYMYSCGRNSVIWTVKPAAAHADCSPRIMDLSVPKQAPEDYVKNRDHFEFSCGRSSPIWDTNNLCSTKVTPRTEQLSRPKTVHHDYKPQRGVMTEIGSSALSASASDRIASLASAKNRPEGPFREPIWTVSGGARSADPSSRCLELARCKSLADGYLPAREVVWGVPRAAIRAVANERTEELAHPIKRATMDHLMFDPDAFVVKVGALKGRCSKRVIELSEPIRR